MSSKTDFATVLGELLTDANLRLRFRDEPERLASELGLGKEYHSSFLSLVPDQLEAQAEILIRKRMNDVARLLPRTWNYLGADQAAQLFREFAAGYWPQGHQRHLNDAFMFGQYLSESGSAFACQAELSFVQFRMSSRSCQIKLVSRAILNGRRKYAVQFLYHRQYRPRDFLLYLRY